MSSFFINHLIVETFFTQYRKVRDQIDTFKRLGTKLANDVKVRDQIRRLCLFWVKITSGNAFPEMRLFGCSGKFYFPEIEIRWPKKKVFDHGNHFTLLFSLQSISEKWERERESARARLRSRRQTFQSPLIAIASDRAVDRDRTGSRRWSRSHRIAPLIAISPSRDHTGSEIAIDASRDRAVDRDLAFARSRRWSRSREEGEITIAISDRDRRRGRRTVFSVVVDDFFSGLWLVFFWICVFLLLFQTPESIFRKIFWNATKHHGNIFLFRKLAFPKNIYFPENVLQQPNTAVVYPKNIPKKNHNIYYSHLGVVTN